MDTDRLCAAQLLGKGIIHWDASDVPAFFNVVADKQTLVSEKGISLGDRCLCHQKVLLK